MPNNFQNEMGRTHKLIIVILCIMTLISIINLAIVAFNAGNIVTILEAAEVVRDGCVM